MATVLSAPSAAHHTQFDFATPETAVAAPEQTSFDLSSSEKAIRNASVVAIIFCVTLLGAISLWLWYGMHQYQNCL
jgi:hypothetical protein